MSSALSASSTPSAPSAWLPEDEVHISEARIFLSQFLRTKEFDMNTLSPEAALLVGLMIEEMTPGPAIKPEWLPCIKAVKRKLAFIFDKTDGTDLLIALFRLMHRWHLSQDFTSSYMRSFLMNFAQDYIGNFIFTEGVFDGMDSDVELELKDFWETMTL